MKSFGRLYPLSYDFLYKNSVFFQNFPYFSNAWIHDMASSAGAKNNCVVIITRRDGLAAFAENFENDQVKITTSAKMALPVLYGLKMVFFDCQ